MRYHVSHQTTYRYADPVLVSLNQACLSPRETPTQRVLRHALRLAPEPSARVAWTDSFGNQLVQFSQSEPHAELCVVAESVVEVTATPADPASSALPWEDAVRAVKEHTTPATLDALQYLFDSPMIPRGPALRAYAAPSFPPGRPFLEALGDLAARMKREFTYDAGATTLLTPVNEVLAKRRGVCQDFAQVLAGALRSHGLAARYVSGYLRTLPPPGKPRLVGADASHCWVSVFTPDRGWVDVDPTNGCFAGSDHITVAWGRDYQDVAPVKGVILGGGQQGIVVGVDVIPEDG